MSSVKPQPLDRNKQVLTVRSVRKKIGGKWIIKGVSFNVGAGEIFGFLGPNGSGKTTTIRMLVGLIRPTEGHIHIDGYDIVKQPVQALSAVGSIVENPELYPYMTGWQNLEHFAMMLDNVDERRIQEVVEIVGMEQRIHDKVKTYSLGMRQRLGIAQALLGRPKLLILDEPTNGLDPQGIKELREFIRSLAQQGISLFISSHLLSEIQLMCDRVAIISHGEVIQVGQVDELVQTKDTLVLWRAEPKQEALAILSSADGTQISSLPEDSSDSSIAVLMDPAAVAELNIKLVEAGIRVQEIAIRPPSLEDLFLRLTGGNQIE